MELTATAFDIDLRNGDYIMFAGATPDTTQINQVINIIRPDQMEVDAGIFPLTGDINYSGVNCFVFDNPASSYENFRNNCRPYYDNCITSRE